MQPWNQETLKLLKEYINSMVLTESDFMKEAVKKIDEKKTLYDALSTKSDELVSPIIDLRFKKILTISKESIEQV
jgi:hypothetical protein